MEKGKQKKQEKKKKQTKIVSFLFNQITPEHLNFTNSLPTCFYFLIGNQCALRERKKINDNANKIK